MAFKERAMRTKSIKFYCVYKTAEILYSYRSMKKLHVTRGYNVMCQGIMEYFVIYL